MSMQDWGDDAERRNPRGLEINLTQCHSTHHKTSHGPVWQRTRAPEVMINTHKAPGRTVDNGKDSSRWTIHYNEAKVATAAVTFQTCVRENSGLKFWQIGSYKNGFRDFRQSLHINTSFRLTPPPYRFFPVHQFDAIQSELSKAS
jgi:hypothetical protein